ncbi:fumarylacetoacetate hydrolase family protein [Acinetobacter modestus]|uniref:fumarylacetoacetate hydrolase family protein n=1 Tax=Acinetobacter modestus TaxID=1776740 RepID=UPI0020309198|nr:fumarylacetoacetate hydrolase family protein [Acinetobacter modestus]MCM1959094.1 fumarylacetoacetate hydrolase family protein [Acinetobacter modestus]
MALHIVHFIDSQQKKRWGLIQEERITPFQHDFDSTKEIIEYGILQLAKLATESTEKYLLDDVELLSPITNPSQILCQGANYRQHMLDSGINPDTQSFNMFFTKSLASLHGPTGWIVKPNHVDLLDYEIELTLVLGKKTQGSVTVSTENLHEYIAGICIGNDVSARDIQIPQMQFYKGKSYRTFCPLGPVMCLLNQAEMHYLNNLQLILKVNDEIRQQDSTENLVFKPAETLTEFSQITNFEVGDVLMTGTPSGCALGLPSSTLIKMTGLLPEKLKWQLFNKSQSRRTKYLKVGDQIESHIFSTDGKINLGYQRHHIS